VLSYYVVVFYVCWYILYPWGEANNFYAHCKIHGLHHKTFQESMTTDPVILHLTQLQTRRAKLAADRDNLTNVIAELDEVIAELDESIRLITVQSNVSILGETHKTAELDGDQQPPPTPQPGVADHHVSSVSILGETHKSAELDDDQQPPPTPQP
jgi:hypothetical protein